jgi:hypothetical protein
MLSYEEKLLIGLDTLKRFKASLRGQEPGSRQRPAARPGRQEYRQGETGHEYPARPSLQAVLQANQPWPHNSCLVGICDDNLPFVLDLTNPTAGGLLVIADPGSGKTRLLESLLASIAALNGPGQALFHIIAQDAQEFERVSQAENCQNIFTVDDPATNPLLEKLALLCNQRQTGSDRGPALMVAIDNLASFLQFLPQDATRDLYTLITQGSNSRVWIIAGVPSTQVERMDEQWLEAFRTLIFGTISDQNVALRLTGDENARTDDLVPGYQFSVPFGEEWLRFWICESEE